MTVTSSTLAVPCRYKQRHLRHDNRFRLAGLLIILLAFVARAYPAQEDAHVHDHEDTSAVVKHEQTTNTFCPVMPDMKVDPAIFTVFEGKKVYFCCPSCQPTFAKNPQKYLSLLPQFAGSALNAGHDHGDHGPGLTLAGLVKPVGITTLSLLVVTVSVALLRRKRPKLLLKWHKRLGIITLLFAALHAIIVLIAH